MEVELASHRYRLDRPDVAEVGSEGDLHCADPCKAVLSSTWEDAGHISVQDSYLVKGNASLHGARQPHAFAPEQLGLDTTSADYLVD